MQAVQISYASLLQITESNQSLCDSVLDWCRINGREDIEFYWQTSVPICRAVMMELGITDFQFCGEYASLNRSPLNKYRPSDADHFDRIQFMTDMAAEGKTLTFFPMTRKSDNLDWFDGGM